MRRTLKCLMVAFLLVPPFASAAEPVLSLESLIEQALTANPEIAAARQRAAAARQQVPQAGALDDPMLGLAALNVPESLDFNAEDMTMKEISLSQRLPFYGKRRLMRQAAERQADAMSAEVDNTANQVLRSVKYTYYELSHVQRAAEVTRRNKAILEDLAKLAQTRYSVGKGIQEDVVRAQVEISRMLDDLLMLEQRRRSQEARLNTLLNRSIAESLGEPAPLRFEPVELELQHLQQNALAGSPMLRAVQHEVAAAQNDLKLAARGHYPDFSLRVAYGQRDNRPDMYSAGVEINLPVFARSKQSRRVDEAAAQLAAREARLTMARNELFFMIADMVSMADRLKRQIELYRTGIIPQTELQIQSAMSAYRVNRADFMTLLDSRMRLYRFELDYHQALTDYAKNIAALEAALGASLVSAKEPKK